MVVPFAAGVPAGASVEDPAPGDRADDRGTHVGPWTADGGVLDALPDTVGPSPVPQAGSNLDAADRLLALNAGDADPLTRSIEQARLASHWQADQMGLVVPEAIPAPDHETPSEAALVLLDRHDVRRDAAQRASAASLDELPAPAAEELTDVLDAMIGLERATQVAYADADPAAVADQAHLVGPDSIAASAHPPSLGGDVVPRLLERADVDLGPVFSARDALLEEVDQLSRAVDRSPAIAAGSSRLVDQPPILTIDTAEDDDTYTEDVAWQIDFGGSDAYENNAGGTNVSRTPATGVASEDNCVIPGFEPATNPPPPEVLATGVVDLGASADRYGNPDVAGQCGHNGGGHWGSGLIVDEGGDDAYVVGLDKRVSGCNGCGSASWGVNGGGSNYGLGLLVDGTGQDLYEAGSNSTTITCPDDCTLGGNGVNGGGVFAGAGLLVDGGVGNDRYLAGNNATVVSCTDCGNGGGGVNGGANAGVGTLVDDGGDDSYRGGNEITVETCPGGNCGVVGVGVNGGAGFGSGLLVDGGGNDTYDAGANGEVLSCEGAACGIGSHGVNGAGQIGRAALVDDGSGDDVYRAGTGVTIHSCASNCDVGAFGVNGGGNTGSGRLVDLGGDDVYLAGTDSEILNCDLGTCDLARFAVNGGSTAGPGLLFDGAGTDRYDDDAGGSGTDVTVIPKGGPLIGAQVDSDDRSP